MSTDFEKIAKRSRTFDKATGYALSTDDSKVGDSNMMDMLKSRYLQIREEQADKKSQSIENIKSRSSSQKVGLMKRLKHFWRKNIKGKKLDSEIKNEKAIEEIKGSDKYAKTQALGNMAAAARMVSKYGIKKDEFENYCYETFKIDRSKPLEGQIVETPTGKTMINSKLDFYDGANITRFLQKEKNIDPKELEKETNLSRNLFIKNGEMSDDYKNYK